MSKVLRILVVTAVIGCVATAQGAERQRKKDFGQEWIRCHEFTIMGLVQRPTAVADNKYSQANMNAMLAWKPREGILESAVRQGLPWHAHSLPAPLSDELKGWLSGLIERFPGCEGVLVWDEPRPEDMEKVAEVVAWVKETYPHTLVYSNGFPADLAYYEKFIKVIQPDILVMDTYPHGKKISDPAGTGLQDNYYKIMSDTREAARKVDIPYWVFIQAYEAGGRRYPSESDLRMQVFSSLAYGVTGIAYFTFDHAFERGLLVSDDVEDRLGGEPTDLYYDVKFVNEEVLNVGKALRYLTNIGVRYVPGKHVVGDNVVRNAVPQGIEAYEGGACGVEAVKRITVKDYGRSKNAMIGFFEDSIDDKYFMLVNLCHGPNMRAQDCKSTVTIEFSPSVKAVARLSRHTGTPELLTVKDGQLQITLLGGTGDLFKIADNLVFPGLGPTPRFSGWARR